MLFDTHAHLDADAFDEDREELIASLPEQGLSLVMNPGCDLASSRKAVEMAGRYDFLYAAVGLVSMGLGLILYRRRPLEVAGDFIAVAPLAPVFSVVFTLCAGAVFASFGELVGNNFVPYLVVGLLVGWFSGRMLLQRTVKVFSGKNFLRLAILVVAVLASVGLTKLDPLGITRWTPDAEQVKSLSVSDNRVYYGEGDVEVKDPQKIQAFIDIHRYVIENGEIRDGGLSRRVSLFFYECF